MLIGETSSSERLRELITACCMVSKITFEKLLGRIKRGFSRAKRNHGKEKGKNKKDTEKQRRRQNKIVNDKCAFCIKIPLTCFLDFQKILDMYFLFFRLEKYKWRYSGSNFRVTSRIYNIDIPLYSRNTNIYSIFLWLFNLFFMFGTWKNNSGVHFLLF